MQGFVTLGWGTASLKFRQFNSAVCDALVGCRYMYCGYGTCTVIPTCFMVWGVGVCQFTT